jgi:hypothetical protein
MRDVDNYTLYYECERCGAKREKHFVKHADLVFMGISKGDIKIAESTGFMRSTGKWYPHPNDPQTNVKTT